MGGTPAVLPAKPSFEADALKVAYEGEIGRSRDAQEKRQLGWAANAPLETFTPDVFGPQGMQTQAAQVAAINAFNSKKAEQETNPAVAAIRERLPKMIEEDLSEDAWKKRMQSWAKDAGITLGVKTGLGDSTVARSALFDAATEEGDRIRKERKAEAAQFLASNPLQNVGLDAGTLLSANQAALQNAMSQRNSFRDAMFGRVAQSNQATSDWLNKMSDTMSRASESYKQSWDNYAQSMAKAAEQKAAAKNKMIGTVAQIGGTAIGSMFGMPMLGSALGGLVGAAVGGTGSGGSDMMSAIGGFGGGGGQGGQGGRYGGLAGDFSSLKKKFSGEEPWFAWNRKNAS